MTRARLTEMGGLYCPLCRNESFNLADVLEFYCGFCELHHDEMVMVTDNGPAHDDSPPGGETAKAKGCCCSVYDNGRGYGQRVQKGRPGLREFIFNRRCPLHGAHQPTERRRYG